MSNYRDESDELAGCIFAIIGLLIGLLTAGIVHYINKERSTPRLPDIPEPGPDYKPAHAQIPTPLALAALGALSLVMALGSAGDPDSGGVAVMCGVAGLVMLGAAGAMHSSKPDETAALENTPQPTFAAVPQLYTVALPRQTKWQPEVAWRFIEQLLQTVPHAVLRIVAEQHHIAWQIIDWRAGVSPETVIQTVHAYYPDAQVEVADYTLPEREYPFYRYTLLFQHAAEFVWPVKFVQDLKDFDPLVTLTQAVSGLEAGERVVYTLALSVPAHYAHREGEKMITTSRIHPLQFLSVWGTSFALMDMTSGQTRDQKYRTVDQNVAYSKLGGPLHQVFLAVQVDSPVKARVRQLANVDTHVWQFERTPYNALVWIPDNWPESVRTVCNVDIDQITDALGVIQACVRGEDKRWPQARLIMAPEEVAALWHLPHEGFGVPEIKWAPGRQLPASSETARIAEGVLLGENRYAGRANPIRLDYADRATHVYVVGKTGVGKSTLLHHIIHQDIAAGKGVGVIDPHGKLVRDILRCSIPPEREDEVVVVDMARTDYPPPLNPFAIPEGVSREVALSQVLGLLKKIYEDDWSKTRMESAIYAALVALLDEPQATPRDISRLFLDEVYRLQLLRQVKDPVALEYWYDEFGNFSEGVQKQTREPVLNRIRIFYRNAAVRNMVCHPHRLDFRQIVEEGKIFLASMSSEEVRSEQANLGAMLMANFQMVAMSRKPTQTYEPYYLFIDEVQQFVTTSLPVVLSEARKFGLSLTVANQFLKQLEGETLEAILGNVGATIAFACGPKDARSLAHVFKPEFAPDDIVNFDKFHAAVKMQAGGKTIPTFSLSTTPPVPVPDDANEREARIREKSIHNYTPWTRQEVEAWMEERYRRPDVQPRGTVTDYD